MLEGWVDEEREVHDDHDDHKLKVILADWNEMRLFNGNKFLWLWTLQENDFDEHDEDNDDDDQEDEHDLEDEPDEGELKNASQEVDNNEKDEVRSQRAKIQKWLWLFNCYWDKLQDEDSDEDEGFEENQLDDDEDEDSEDVDNDEDEDNDDNLEDYEVSELLQCFLECYEYSQNNMMDFRVN